MENSQHFADLGRCVRALAPRPTHKLKRGRIHEIRINVRQGTFRACVSCSALCWFQQLRHKAQTFSVIHNFAGGSDGANPLAGFTIDVAGNLYGTASAGGSSGAGVVFKLTTSGQETVLHNFTGGSDGANPQASLVLDKAGNLYGTTYAGGVSNDGTVFQVTRTGKEKVLHSFAGGADGANPIAALAIDKTGNLYGTTTAGGSSGKGTVYMLSVPSFARRRVEGKSLAQFWHRH